MTKITSGIMYPHWFNVKDQLPPLFQNVIVYGYINELNVCKQAWEARRWTGHTSGFDVEKDILWEWVTPTDIIVKEVTHWMPLPITIPV